MRLEQGRWALKVMDTQLEGGPFFVGDVTRSQTSRCMPTRMSLTRRSSVFASALNSEGLVLVVFPLFRTGRRTDIGERRSAIWTWAKETVLPVRQRLRQ